MALEQYRRKRNFQETPEPSGRDGKAHRQPIFVVQEHHATRLHYDFRLEADGVLKSWAVPKGPSMNPSDKRLAVHVEDHPVEYAKFAGTIPEGSYGAGTVQIWDHGTYQNLLADKPKPLTMSEGIAAGRLEFELHGQRLKGRFALIRLRGGKGGKDNWLLIKMKDEYAREESSPNSAAKKTTRPVARKTPRPRVSRSSKEKKSVELTHGDKTLFPEDELTKKDVFDFYRRISSRLLPYLRDRPVTLERLPEGIGGTDKPHFWQKNTPDYYPDWIPRVDLPSEAGRHVNYVLVNDKETLLYLVNQGALTFHVGLSRLQDLERPDFVLFDLDPGGASFADVMTVAKQLHELLEEKDKQAFVKTSGKSGLHVLVPWDEDADFGRAREWALGVAERVVDRLPKVATTERSKVKRQGRVYVDVMQNANGHHAVPPYVIRAVPGAPVSTPLSWRELRSGLTPVQFNVKTISQRLARQKRDPMAALLRVAAHT
jgi:bifunctional non-homologous end joining protein LigD